GWRSSPAARRRSTSAAVASAASGVTEMNEPSTPSVASMRSRWARVTSVDVYSSARMPAASWAAVSRVRSWAMSVLPQDLRNEELAVLRRGGTRQRLLRSQRAPHDVVAEDVRQRNRVAGRRNVVRRHLRHPGDVGEDLIQVPCCLLKLFAGHGDPGELRQVLDLSSGDRGCVSHPHPLSDDSVPRASLRRSRQCGGRRMTGTCERHSY